MNDIKLIKKLINEKIKTISPIKVGISNKNYIVNDKYVVRIKNSDDKFYNYKKEINFINNISFLKQSEETIALDKDGNKVSIYIKGLIPIKYKDIEIKKIARMIKNIHETRIKIRHNFNPLKRFYYYKTFYEKETFIHEKYILKRFKKIYRSYPLVLSHNDLVKNNILFKDDKSYLIDYEYAGKNIFLFDLASFISENNLVDSKKIRIFLNEYGLEKSKYNELSDVIMFENLLWFYWAIERYKSTKRPIYKKISIEKKDKIKQDLKYLAKKNIIF